MGLMVSVMVFMVVVVFVVVVSVVVSVTVVVFAVVAAGGWGWEVGDSRMMEDTEHSMKQSMGR